MSEWSFILRLNQPLTAEQANAFDHCDAFADGSVSYVLGPEHPSQFAVHTDPAELSELSCGIEALSFLDAVAQVARDIRLIPGLHAVSVRHDDTVTLGEAAQRCDRNEESLAALPGFPEPLPGPPGATVFYSWRKIAEFLRSIGDTVPETPRELAVADQVLRLAHELESLDVAPGTLRALGLPTGTP
ncbi:hypothetical protein [Streptomyces niveus]|uniref:hypothetical protein n=1 Tax=Streptomyces niveus TaxID=193462 RepID=UPI00343F09BB